MESLMIDISSQSWLISFTSTVGHFHMVTTTRKFERTRRSRNQKTGGQRLRTLWVPSVWQKFRGKKFWRQADLRRHGFENWRGDSIWKLMNISTQEKSHMSAPSVRKHLKQVWTWRLMNRYTQEQSHLHAPSVTRHFQRVAIWRPMNRPRE